MKRKLKWIGVVLAVSLVGFGVALSLLPRDSVNREGFEKIQLGMTMLEVQEILGGPPGDYSTGPVEQVELGNKRWFVSGSFETSKTWYGDEGELKVWFNDQGVVIIKHMVPGFRVEASFFHKLRRWLPL